MSILGIKTIFFKGDGGAGLGQKATLLVVVVVQQKEEGRMGPVVQWQ